MAFVVFAAFMIVLLAAGVFAAAARGRDGS